MERLRKAILSANLRFKSALYVLAFIAALVSLFPLNLHAENTSDTKTESPTETLKKIEARLEKIERNQETILKNQELAFEDLRVLRIWVHKR